MASLDAVVTALIGAAPQLGAGGLLVVLFGLLLRWATQDRSDYRATLDAVAARHTAELGRLAKAHDDELFELRAELKGLRAQLDEVNAKLDEERARRRAAEDAAAARQDPAVTQLEPPWGGESPWRHP